MKYNFPTVRRFKYQVIGACYSGNIPAINGFCFYERTDPLRLSGMGKGPIPISTEISEFSLSGILSNNNRSFDRLKNAGLFCLQSGLLNLHGHYGATVKIAAGQRAVNLKYRRNRYLRNHATINIALRPRKPFSVINEQISQRRLYLQHRLRSLFLLPVHRIDGQ